MSAADADYSRVSTGFPPVARRDARLLILGSLPGQRSLAACEYYAHPRNAFWRLADDLFGVSADADYSTRINCLQARGVALWDVLQSSLRPGSLDASIDLRSARCNDFATFLESHDEIQLIAFNGRKAAELFNRRVLPSLPDTVPNTLVLPSTSPAHAAMSYALKRAAWSALTTVL